MEGVGGRRRLGRIKWWTTCPPEVRARYDAVRGQLAGDRGTVAAAMNLLCHFATEYNSGNGGHPLELSTLSATAGDAERAAAAWDRLCHRGRWTRKHLAETRTSLSRALLCIVPGLAYVVNPAMRRGPAVRYVTDRSHRTNFLLHECLPYGVRKLGATHMEYRILERIGTAMADAIRSASREGLYQILLFFDRLLHGLPAVWPPDAPDAEARWTALRGLSGVHWLQRYVRLFPQCQQGSGDAAPRFVTLDLLRKELRWLSLFHGRVLHPADTGRLSIPLPKRSGRAGGLGPLMHGGNRSSSAGPASATEGGSDGALEAHQQMVDLVCVLRSAAVREESDPPVPAAQKAFTVDEVRRIVQAADSTRERLLVMLLITTGLRRGGVARLRGPPAATVGHATDVPVRLATTEKNNARREVRLSPTVRVLLAQWYRHCRRVPDANTNPYVFPDRTGSSHASGATVAQICANVLRRAGVYGPVARVHAFRHTVVKILWMKGNTFEQIAKWIGHRSVSVTANDYGNLATEEVQNRMVGLDWLGTPEDAARERDSWRELTDFLYAPYTFPPEAWPGHNAVPRAAHPWATVADDSLPPAHRRRTS